MSKQDHYTYSNTYEYDVEIPYEGAAADGIEGAETLSGEVTWEADISWNESLGQYEVDMDWNDHEDQFSHDGNGPREDDFIDDLYSHLGNEGIGSEDITY